jgi:alpha-tubulin suppressor-like RCC1 family protein
MTHSLAIDLNGGLWASGANLNGQLGLDDLWFECFTKVTNFGGETPTFKAIAAGLDNSIAIDSNGALWAAGKNDKGQLGLGDKKSPDRFTKVTEFYPTSSPTFQAVAIGQRHAIALDDNGVVWTSGFNDSGQLGLGDKTDRLIFTKVTSSASGKITHIAAGHWHTFALDNSGGLWAAGMNSKGELGLGAVNQADRVEFTKVERALDKVSALPPTDSSIEAPKFAAIYAKHQHSVALSAATYDGDLWVTGFEYFGEHGLCCGGNNTRWLFTKVSPNTGGVLLPKLSAAAVGDYHTVALAPTTNSLWVTGDNDYGALGLGDNDNRFAFEKVVIGGAGAIKKIEAGAWNTFAIDANGDLWATGDNAEGQLGLGDNDDRNRFIKVVIAP